MRPVVLALLSDPNKKMKELNDALAKKLKGICRARRAAPESGERKPVAQGVGASGLARPLPAMCNVTYVDAVQEETVTSISDTVLSCRLREATTTKMRIKGQGLFVTAQLVPGRRDKPRISLSQSGSL
jgi:hypothetical protein